MPSVSVSPPGASSGVGLRDEAAPRRRAHVTRVVYLPDAEGVGAVRVAHVVLGRGACAVARRPPIERALEAAPGLGPGPGEVHHSVGVRGALGRPLRYGRGGGRRGVGWRRGRASAVGGGARLVGAVVLVVLDAVPVGVRTGGSGVYGEGVRSRGGVHVVRRVPGTHLKGVAAVRQNRCGVRACTRREARCRPALQVHAAIESGNARVVAPAKGEGGCVI